MEEKNLCHIIGQIGTISRQTIHGNTMVTAQIATSQIYRNKNYTLIEELSWHTIKAYEKSHISKELLDSLKVGSYITVTGHLLTESHTNSNNKIETRSFILAETMYEADPKTDDTVNEIELCGPVGTCRTSEFGKTKTCSFSLQTNLIMKDMNGGIQMNTTWHSVKAFSNNIPTKTMKQITEGTILTVKGYIHYDRYTTDTGEEKTQPSITATHIEPAIL